MILHYTAPLHCVLGDERDQGKSGTTRHNKSWLAQGAGALVHGTLDHGALDHGALDHGAHSPRVLGHEAKIL